MKNSLAPCETDVNSAGDRRELAGSLDRLNALMLMLRANTQQHQTIVASSRQLVARTQEAGKQHQTVVASSQQLVARSREVSTAIIILTEQRRSERSAALPLPWVHEPGSA